MPSGSKLYDMLGLNPKPAPAPAPAPKPKKVKAASKVAETTSDAEGENVKSDE